MPAKIFDDDLALEPSSQGANIIDSEVKPAATANEPVVISGVAGRLPESDNMAEFREHLVAGDDMVTEDDRRWPPGIYGLPRRNGKLKDISKFDASFFGVHPKQANSMDPQLRLLLEVTYEAIVDAGVNPTQVRGSKTGVFIGCSASEAHDAWSVDIEGIVGYEMTGCTRSMFANRLSFFFDFKGPSFAIDTACSSSLLALDQALHSIRSGACDSAIVGGCSLCLKPATSLQFQRLGMLAGNGTCKSFDASGEGYCRSEAVVCIYLQRERAARRIYATLVHSGTNSDGLKSEGITFPSGEVQARLLRSVYREAGVDPAAVTYVEAHGTGTQAGDPQELNSISDVFCPAHRQGPLLVGSTKSNMGHPEPASGLAALAKVLVAMEDGALPANLHYSTPNPNIPGLTDGRLKVVSERLPWSGGYVGINSFGFGGSNVHCLLKSSTVGVPRVGHPSDAAPRLCVIAGRNEEAVTSLLTAVHESRLSAAGQTLLQAQAAVSPTQMPYRGACIVNMDNPQLQVQKVAGERRPVWYVFAGMGTQWARMGRRLMTVDVFRQSVMRSDAVLAPQGVKLYDLIMNGDDTAFDSTQNSFIGIATIQVALVDTLTAVGVACDGVVGHSVGELGCAYATGGLTAAETVLAAYWRGRCVVEANLPPGAMAAVGLTWAEAKQRCPEGVVAACHNAEDTVTISGPQDTVRDFVTQLKAESVFAKEVNSAGVAFHSYFMKRTAQALQSALEAVITEKRQRSPKWISSSIPEAGWSSDLARYSSADYHVNNLLSPVLFQEALSHVPNNAVVIEIAPHCLLQAILKRSLATDCVFVGLMKRGHPDNVEFLLQALGKVYVSGVDVCPLRLYPALPEPVSKGTPMLSSLVAWDHTQSWQVPTFEDFSTGGAGGGKAGVSFKIDVSPESEDHYLTGHRIDGRVLFPATGYLVLVWRAIAKINGLLWTETPVSFDDITIHRATILPKTGAVTLDVSVMPASGDFEVCEAGQRVVSGRVTIPTPPILHLPAYESASRGGDHQDLTSQDVYKELRLRGYDYGPTFQGILSAAQDGSSGYLAWNGNWVSLLDTLLQIQVLGHGGRSLRLPTRIKQLRVDPTVHATLTTEIDSQRQAVKVVVDRVCDTCCAGGVEMLGLHATVAPRRQGQQASPTLETFSFLPYTQRHAPGVRIEAALSAARHGLQRCITAGHTSASSLFSQIPATSSSAATPSNTNPLLELVDRLTSPPPGTAFASHVGAVAAEASRDTPLFDAVTSSSVGACSDIVLENMGVRLRAVEVGAESGHLYKIAIPRMQGQPLVAVNYSACVAAAEALPVEVLERHDMSEVVWSGAGPAPSGVGGADLVLCGASLHAIPSLTEHLSHLVTLLKDGAFLLLRQPTHHLGLCSLIYGVTDLTPCGRTLGPFCDSASWRDVITSAGLSVVAEYDDTSLHTVFLCRKPAPVTSASPATLICVDDDKDFTWVEEVKAALATADDAPPDARIWLMSRVADNGIVGLSNCLRQEVGGARLRCLHMTESSSPDMSPSSPAFQDLQARDLVMNVWRDGTWGSLRHSPYATAPRVRTSHAYVNVLTRGDLASLAWIESPLKYYQPDANKELCRVAYTSLNFRDVMLATGKLPPDAIPGDLAATDCLLGMEFAGWNSTGERVMGLLPAKGLATAVDCHKQFLWKVPEAWSLAEAATVPVVYTTAYYALVVRAGLRAADRVLIHSGTGGVGQAAIAIALHTGCEVFTTVGSDAKRAYLAERFPALKPDHISNSRDITFAWDVLRATGGRGVDVVLNSLAEEKLEASLRCLAPHGRFLEIGKYDLANNTPLGMALFLKNVSFHGILLDALFEADNADWRRVAGLLTDGIGSGAVRPLQNTVFPGDDIEGAFRFMAQGKHIGKVLVDVGMDASDDAKQPKDSATVESMGAAPTISAIPRSACHPHKCYVLVGGLGGFGLELARWLVERGATRLVLTSRGGVRNAYQARCLRAWADMGVTVSVSTRDVTSLDDAHALMREAAALGPVGGVFNLAMVLRDGLIENQHADAFRAVAAPKVAGTRHLDLATRCTQHSNSLDWFVVFSSVSCGRGNAGQANYGFANSVMERVCERRRRDGLPALAVQWGAIGDVGVVLDTMGGNETVIGGTLPQRITSCLDTLDTFLNQPHPVMASLVLAERRKKAGDGEGRPDLVQAVAHILGVSDASTVPSDASLADLGLDSLMGVEVKQTLERDHDVTLTMRDIRALTLDKLRAIAAGDVSGSGESRSVTPPVEKSLDDSAISMRFDLTQLVPEDTLTILKEGDRESPLFVIHPIEGSCVSLEWMCSHCEGPVYGLQCSRDAPLESITALANFYIEEMSVVRRGGGPLRLAGYSFGACVAVEMTSQLEARGEHVHLALLDGSHTFVAQHTTQHTMKFGSQKIEEFSALAESEALCAFVLQFMPIDYTKLKEELQGLESWAVRVSRVCDVLADTLHDSCGRDDLAAAMLSFYNKLRAAHAYSLSGQLAANVMLVRAAHAHAEAQSMGDDYGLGQVVSGTLTVHQVDGDHASFIQGESGMRVAALLDTLTA